MSFVPVKRRDWPVLLSQDCAAIDFVDCVDDGLTKLRRSAVGLVVALLIVAAIVSVLSGASLAFNGGDRTFEERANVMTARQVATTIMTGGDRRLLDEFVAPEASIKYPGGSVNGPLGAARLSELLTDEGEYRGFTVWDEMVDGQSVTLNWKLEGPVYPGSLVWTSVPEGSAISGQMLLTVDRGLVFDLVILVQS